MPKSNNVTGFVISFEEPHEVGYLCERFGWMTWDKPTEVSPTDRFCHPTENIALIKQYIASGQWAGTLPSIMYPAQWDEENGVTLTGEPIPFPMP